MALVADWSALTGQIHTRYFAGGDATNFCVHTVPAWARKVTVCNRGTGLLVVSAPGVAGAASATAHAAGLIAGQRQQFVLASGGKSPMLTIGTWGADGATHPMDLLFEAH